MASLGDDGSDSFGWEDGTPDAEGTINLRFIKFQYRSSVQVLEGKKKEQTSCGCIVRTGNNELKSMLHELF